MTVAKVEMYRGVPTLFIDGVPHFAYVYFFAANDKYIPDFAKAGVHIYTWGWSKVIPHSMEMGWIGPGKYDYRKLDRDVKRILKADPQAYIFPRVAVSPPNWWYDLHPEEMNTYDNGEKEGVCVASRIWRQEAGKAFVNLISHIRNAPYRDHFIGYQVTGGFNEWFNVYHNRPFSDYSRPMVDAFREWLRKRYEDDVSLLRDSWKKPDVDFQNATIPTRDERLRTDLNLFREPSISRHVSDYYEFYSDAVADALIYFCKLGKEATSAESIFGAFYGYLIGAACWPTAFSRWGHQALKKVLDSPYVDFLCAPYTYYRRGPGGFDGPQVPIESVKLHGKLWFTECDTWTFLTDFEHARERGTIPKSLEETLGVLKRDFSNALTRGVGLWWMDIMLEGGWYDHPGIMDCIARMKRIADQSLNLDRSYQGGVAVIVDEHSAHYLKPGYELTYPLIYMQSLLHLSRIGTPYDLYLHDDLSNPSMPSYRLYVFLNTFYLTEEERRAIKSKVQRDGSTALWVYAPGFIGENGFSPENIYDLTGMRIAYKKVSHFYPSPPHGAPLHVYLTNFDHPITTGLPPNTVFGTDNSIGPYFYCIDPEAITLGNLLSPHCGVLPELPGFCVKEFDDWRSIFVGAPNIPSNVLRNIAKYAGVHIYSDDDDVVYANNNFLAIHTNHAGKRTIRLPRRCSVYDVFEDRLVAEDVGEFVDDLPQYTTALYFIGDAEQLPVAKEPYNSTEF